MAKRTIYVTRTSIAELTEKWSYQPGMVKHHHKLYIRCNAAGEVNWKNAPVYYEIWRDSRIVEIKKPK